MLDDDATAVTRPRHFDNREQCAAAAAAAAAAEPRVADTELLVLRVSPTDGLNAVKERVVRVRNEATILYIT